MKIGILALQGAVAPHEEKLRKLGVEPVQVRRASDLASLSAIVLPGGESSAMIHLLNTNQLWAPLKTFCETHPTWGVCAGSILLAAEVTSPCQASFAQMEVRAVRNAYGRQLESFIDTLDPTDAWKGLDPIEGVFIRAPRLVPLSDRVRILFRHHGEPVMIQQGHWLASAFHPELSGSTEIHNYFLTLCAERFPHGRTISSMA